MSKLNTMLIRGTRGTLPTCGAEFLRYGGDTTCFSLLTEQGLLIIDAGTGIARVTHDLTPAGQVPPITLLFTHLHLDHLVGLPGFGPLYSGSASVRLMADPRRAEDWKQALHAFMRKPYWPIGLAEADADLKCEDIPVHQDAMNIYGVRVSWFSVPHPQQCLAYRLVTPDRTVVIATDCEYEKDKVPSAFIAFCSGADFLVFDANYTPEEHLRHRGWGHSTWETAARVAAAARVKRLVLTHHAPTRSDAQIDDIVRRAQQSFPATTAACSDMELARPEFG